MWVVADGAAAHLLGSPASDQQCLGLLLGLLHLTARAGGHGRAAQRQSVPDYHPHRACILGSWAKSPCSGHEQ